MFDFPYLVEMLTPKRIEPAISMEQLNLFAERYYRILDQGLGLSVPDNPMGQRRESLIDMIEKSVLPVPPDKIVMNLNTFHEKDALDRLLRRAETFGIRQLIVVRGDGGPLLEKLDPASIGGAGNVATSIDLLGYINRQYPGAFVTGCAFNQYNPMPFETNRLVKKIEAGAKFVVTQSVIAPDENVDGILKFGIPVVIEAWMSKNMDLLFRSIRKPPENTLPPYHPEDNLRQLHWQYPEHCIYLSMLGFRKQWRKILPRL